MTSDAEHRPTGSPRYGSVGLFDGIPYDVIAGTFILCDENLDGEFVSITPEHEAKYMERYSREMILSHAEPTRDVTER